MELVALIIDARNESFPRLNEAFLKAFSDLILNTI